jgi:cytochrome c
MIKKSRMKKVVILWGGLLAAVFSSYQSFSQKQTKKPVAKTSSSKADIEQGKNLISKSDCLACHQLDKRVVGPAYNAVAKKYPATDANINKLADKVIKGGSGVWGQVPMNPHPTVPAEDAKKMVRYILSIK